MALSNTSINDIVANIIGDIETATGETIPLLQKAVFRFLAKALAGVWVILYKYSSDAYRQRFPQTANSLFLQILGDLVNKPIDSATIWEGDADIVATGSTGNIEAETLFVDNETGKVFSVVSTVAITPATLSISLIATESGELSDLIVGDTPDIVSPLPGVALTAEITSVTTEGEDIEDLEVYRERIIDRYQAFPQGGAQADYRIWGLDAPSFINIYPYWSETVPNEVDLYGEVDDQTDGIPTAGQLLDMADAVEFDPTTGVADRRPVTAVPNSYAITRRPFDVTIYSLSPGGADTKTEIEAALTTYFLGKEPYIEGLSISRIDTVTEGECSAVIGTITQARGETFSNVVLEDVTGVINLHVLGRGEKAKVDNIYYA